MTTLLDHSEAHQTGYLNFCLFVSIDTHKEGLVSISVQVKLLSQLDSHLDPKQHRDLAGTKGKQARKGFRPPSAM